MRPTPPAAFFPSQECFIWQKNIVLIPPAVFSMAGLPCTVYFKWYKEANEVNTTSSLQGNEMVDLVTDLIKGVVDCDFTFFNVS